MTFTLARAKNIAIDCIIIIIINHYYEKGTFPSTNLVTSANADRSKTQVGCHSLAEIVG
jgi:hypothetical protein